MNTHSMTEKQLKCQLEETIKCWQQHVGRPRSQWRMSTVEGLEKKMAALREEIARRKRNARDPRVLYSLLVPRLLTDEEAEAELQDLIDGREDEEWHRRGQW